MFCPVCKAEYRQGITFCSDCNVALVPSFPGAQGVSAVPSGYLVELWTGENLALHASLLDALEQVGIKYFDRPLGTLPGLRRAEPLPVAPRPRFGFEVQVLSSDLALAREILEKLLEAEPEDVPLPADDGQISMPPPSRPSAGEEPTCEVWAGADERVAEFLENALRENEISIRISNLAGETRVYVPLADEPRAREILREITEASPPT